MFTPFLCECVWVCVSECLLQNHPKGIVAKYVYLISIQNSLFCPILREKTLLWFCKIKRYLFWSKIFQNNILAWCYLYLKKYSARNYKFKNTIFQLNVILECILNANVFLLLNYLFLYQVITRLCLNNSFESCITICNTNTKTWIKNIFYKFTILFR